MKRFYKEVTLHQGDQGFSVSLDGREVKTPLKAALLIPTKALADHIAAEWDAQTDKIKPKEMHLTQLANTAIDRVEARRDEILAELTSYAGTDLICYYSDYPEALVEKQKALWAPFHAFLADQFGVTFQTTAGVMHVAQDDAVLAKLRAHIEGLDSFRLTALHAFTTGLGSFTMGLKLVHGQATLDQLWPAALVDELFQEEEWGADEENVTRRKTLYFDMQMAEKFLNSL